MIITFRNYKDIVGFSFLVLDTTEDTTDDACSSIAGELEKTIASKAVRFVLKQHKDNPRKAIIYCVPADR